jgi:tetratricopeptide (TPR) repeat protein
MKTRLILLLLSLALPVTAQQTDGQAKAEQYYRQGMADLKAGQLVSAREAFTKALQLNPNHPNARYQLTEMNLNNSTLSATARERKLSTIEIPEVNFQDATLDEVLQSLDALIRKQTSDQFTPNFVLQDPQKVLADRKISIRLRKIPASAVLKYALEQAGAEAKYDEHAIVIKPNK